MALSKEEVSKIVAKYGKNEKDTGSIEVQIALLTEQIKKLSLHMNANKHDYSSKRGLSILVGQRKGLIEYLKRTDFEKYQALIKDLGLRK